MNHKIISGLIIIILLSLALSSCQPPTTPTLNPYTSTPLVILDPHTPPLPSPTPLPTSTRFTEMPLPTIAPTSTQPATPSPTQPATPSPTMPPTETATVEPTATPTPKPSPTSIYEARLIVEGDMLSLLALELLGELLRYPELQDIHNDNADEFGCGLVPDADLIVTGDCLVIER